MDAAMDRGREGGGGRVVGEYVLGPRIGSGSFAVVYRATHRALAVEVAVKEIDRKQLSRKVNDSLVKEIAILNQIDHPNIIRFHQSIEVRLFSFRFLVLLAFDRWNRTLTFQFFYFFEDC